MTVSVVVPTYRRGLRLGMTLDHLLASEVRGLDAIDVVVVDDGSPEPAEGIVLARAARPPFTLSLVRQDNRGPAAARNTGLRGSTGDVVVFLDDDILVPPELLRLHVDAHRQNTGSVVFGQCPFVPGPPSPLRRYVGALGGRPETTPTFRTVERIASGQLSVGRRLLEGMGGAFYREELNTPAAEEFELSFRLRGRGTPLLFAPHIVALHDQPVNLQTLSLQNYKYGVGLAEALVKCPELSGMAELDRIRRTNGPIARGEPVSLFLKKALRAPLGAAGTRGKVVAFATRFERLVPESILRRVLYPLVLSSHFQAGFRHGLVEFAGKRPA